MKSSSQKLPAVLLAAALDPLLLGVAGDRAVQADRPVAHRAKVILVPGSKYSASDPSHPGEPPQLAHSNRQISPS